MLFLYSIKDMTNKDGGIRREMYTLKSKNCVRKSNYPAKEAS